MDEYKEVLDLLQIRLEEKHNQYGVSYLEKSDRWLRRRLQGELDELDAELFSNHLSGENRCTEALDVAICALLIADNARRFPKTWPNTVETSSTSGNPSL